jgi:glycosyltransferase involved in cell wall biosynthesis
LSNGVNRGTTGELVSIVVPVYNEQDTIAAVVERLLTIALPVPREIIIINDGSRDRTAETLARLAERDRGGLTIIDLPENRGKGHAVRLGFARAGGTIVAIQDADLELDPAQIASLVTPILEGRTDVVYGSRFLAPGSGSATLGYAANRGLTWLTNVLYGVSLTDMETCYKVMRTEVARALPLTADRFEIEPEITARLAQGGHGILEVPVAFTPRSRAAGKKIGWRDGITAIQVLLRCRRA